MRSNVCASAGDFPHSDFIPAPITARPAAKLFLTLIPLLVGLSLPASAQMSLPGKFEVTDTGSASYTVPISVVPGAAGLEPKLSLQYDSRGGNGLLGVGWSLAGLPAITRCGRTIAQDGAVGGVSYDVNDRFCLDGQRLVALNGATYGADGTEYRTERESFSKVISYGTAGSGPDHFVVWTKAGLVMEFGNTADSRIEAQGKTSVRVWAINRTSDTKGNYFTVGYTEDNANGEYRPDRIDYTGNATAGTSPTNSVRFTYETRPDIVPLYQAGSLIKTTQRMTKVQAWQGNAEVREYRLGYEVSTSSALSRLTDLALCLSSGDQTCLPPTGFTWTDTSNQFSNLSSIVGMHDGQYGNWQFQLADFNGDGLSDVFVTYSSGTTGYREIWKNNGDGTFDQWLNLAGQDGLYGNWQFQLADFNGDGLTDIFVTYSSGTTGYREIWRNRGDGTFEHLTSIDGMHDGLYGAWQFQLADFNGDGLADVFVTYAPNGYREIWRNRGDGTFGQQSSIVGMHDGQYGDWQFQLADFNGDGLSDVFVTYSSGTTGYREIWKNNGDGTFDQWLNLAGQDGLYGNWQFQLADFNGDGLTDIFVTYSSGTTGYREIWRNRGDGTFEHLTSIDGMHDGLYGAWQFQLADFNGDGLADVFVTYAPNGYREIWMNRGDGTFGHLTSIDGMHDGFYGAWQFRVADFNGDGLSDVFVTYAPNGYREIWLAGGSVGDRLSSAVSVGIAQFSASYSTLSRAASGYVKDIGASACMYPCVDVQGPLYVVSEVKSSDGVGGEYRSTYRYAGAKSDLHGRGFLGFRQMVVRDEQTGVEQTTAYRQDYPFTGLVAKREKALVPVPGGASALLNRSTNTYDATDLGGTRRYPFLTQSLEESWELATGGGQGAALPSVTTAYQYDAWGNATQVGVSTGDGHSKTTTNTYSNDATGWLLGRLTRSVVTSTTPGN